MEAVKPMAYEEALARIMLVLSANSWGDPTYSIKRASKVNEPTRALVGKLRHLRGRGWVTAEASGFYTYWRLTPDGVKVQRMLRVVRDRTVQSPAWP